MHLGKIRGLEGVPLKQFPLNFYNREKKPEIFMEMDPVSVKNADELASLNSTH